MVHAVFPPKAINALHAARGVALMSLAIAGIALVALALYVVDRRSARQFWGAASSY